MASQEGKNLRDYLPDANTVVDLEPEELGLILLRLMNAIASPHGYNFGNLVGDASDIKRSGYPPERCEAVAQAVSEAWAWLVSQGLLCQRQNDTNWLLVTRRGRRIVDEQSAADYRKASLLPWQLVHPTIAGAARASFLRGDYQTAVFQAFKEVEIAVRAAGAFADTDIGVPLMRKAFDFRGGPLTDSSLPESEREALAHLVAGAIGSYKNPHSHRTVTLNDPTDAVEMIMLASHLLRIVDARKPKPPESNE